MRKRGAPGGMDGEKMATDWHSHFSIFPPRSPPESLKDFLIARGCGIFLKQAVLPRGGK